MLATSCSTQAPPPAKPAAPAPIASKPFGKTADGRAVTTYTLTNKKGMSASIIDYGGIVTSIMAPDKTGAMTDVVLGFGAIEGYEKNPAPYFGALIGRYGNRIGKASFKLEGKEYKLAANNGPNHLHGGIKGFDKAVWQAKELPGDEPGLALTYTSKDGEEGYPGTLNVTVAYTLTNANELKIDYAATTDKDTVLNLTNHSYFNLAGAGQGDVLGHEIQFFASKFTPVDKGLIPTGELKPVKGTPFDFSTPTAIGARIDAADEQIKLGGGYDHNFVLDSGGGALSTAARVREPKSGRTLEVMTTEPGVQFYTGKFLDGTIIGKGGKTYPKHAAFCLETQHFPDSPNKPAFPTTVLKAGAEYKSTTVFRFGVE